MTQRTESYVPTPIEKAVQDIMNTIWTTATIAYAEHRVVHQQGISEKEFFRILALYLHDRSLTDWCNTLRIENPETQRHQT